MQYCRSNDPMKCVMNNSLALAALCQSMCNIKIELFFNYYNLTKTLSSPSSTFSLRCFPWQRSSPPSRREGGRLDEVYLGGSPVSAGDAVIAVVTTSGGGWEEVVEGPERHECELEGEREGERRREGERVVY